MILKTHTNRLNERAQLIDCLGMNGLRTPDIPPPVRNVGSESGTGFWEQKHWPSSPLRTSPTGHLLSRQHGRWSFELLGPNLITDYCKNIPNALVLAVSHWWLKCQGGQWLGSVIFVIHSNRVMHDGASELSGVCVCVCACTLDPDHLFKSQLPSLPALWLEASYLTSCVSVSICKRRKRTVPID